jgi:hypothetical protein
VARFDREWIKQDALIDNGRYKELLTHAIDLLHKYGNEVSVTIEDETLYRAHPVPTVCGLWRTQYPSTEEVDMRGTDVVVFALASTQKPVQRLVISTEGWFWNLGHEFAKEEYNAAARVFGGLTHLTLSLQQSDWCEEQRNAQRVSHLLTKMPLIKLLHLDADGTDESHPFRPVDILMDNLLRSHPQALERLRLYKVVFDVDALCAFIHRCSNIRKVHLSMCDILVSASTLKKIYVQFPELSVDHALTRYIEEKTGAELAIVFGGRLQLRLPEAEPDDRWHEDLKCVLVATGSTTSWEYYLGGLAEQLVEGDRGSLAEQLVEAANDPNFSLRARKLLQAIL